MINTKITDGTGNHYRAKVTMRGQLVTAPLSFSEPYTATVNATGTAFVLAAAKTGKRFVITDILLDADKNVSASTAGTIVLYEATASDSTTAAKTILSIEMLKNTDRAITGLNMIVTENVWLNIKTTDATIYATVLGYYVEA